MSEVQENRCCPYFCVLACGDTMEHNHGFCEYMSAILGRCPTNQEIIERCFGDFKSCRLSPDRGDFYFQLKRVSGEDGIAE